MSGYHYVWFLWSSAFFAAFLLIYLLSPANRSQMLRAAAATVPFGLTEPLFVPAYWNPPSLFDLAQRTGFDLESLIFTFSIGGVAVILYNWLTGQTVVALPQPARSSRHHRLHGLALLTPALIFVLAAPLGWNPIYPAAIAMSAGAGAAVICRPDLLAKTLVGGLLFLGFYALFMLALILSAPGYVEQVWNLAALSGLRPLGIPVEELMFGFAFGLYWSSVYEHLTWSRTLRSRRPATAATGP